MPSVIHTGHVSLDHFAPLKGVADVLQAPAPGQFLSREEVMELGRQHNVMGILTPGELRVDEPLIQALHHLRIVANCAAGFDNLDLKALTRHRVWGTNTPESYVDATADATLALLLAVARKVPQGDAWVRSGEWPKQGLLSARWEGIQLRGRTLGIIGYGRIGEGVAERARAFGMKVLVNRRTPLDSPEYRRLDELLRESDFVSLTCPLTPETHHLIDRETLALMKPGAVLINLARGKVVDEAALVEALQSGHLAGAGLDVFEQEPEVHPELLKMPQVVLTPHIGGSTMAAREHSRHTAAENIARVIRGERPVHAVNEVDV